MANDSEVLIHYFNDSDDYLDPFEGLRYLHQSPKSYALGSLFIIAIIVGVVSNALGLASLVHFRMWLRHEGYFYLVAIFAANIGILLFDCLTYCLSYWNFRDHLTDSSEFMCRVWHFLMSIHFVAGWLSVALLLNMYLQVHLNHTQRCGCPIFAAKFCTLFASKIIVGIIFGIVFIFALPILGLCTLVETPYGTFCASDTMALELLFLVEWCVMWALPFVFFVPVILLLALCPSREGDRFGFSRIDERSISTEQFRTVAAILSSSLFFFHFVLVADLHIVPRYIFHYLITTSIQGAFSVGLGLQPMFCVIILREFRGEVLQKLRNIGVFNRLCPNIWSPRDLEDIRLQDVEEIPDSE